MKIIQIWIKQKNSLKEIDKIKFKDEVGQPELRRNLDGRFSGFSIFIFK